MDKVTLQCLNCKKESKDEHKVEKGLTIVCDECGCIQKCIDKDKYISRWRVMNPFDIEDKRGV